MCIFYDFDVIWIAMLSFRLVLQYISFYRFTFHGCTFVKCTCLIALFEIKETKRLGKSRGWPSKAIEFDRRWCRFNQFHIHRMLQPNGRWQHVRRQQKTGRANAYDQFKPFLFHDIDRHDAFEIVHKWVHSLKPSQNTLGYFQGFFWMPIFVLTFFV